LGWKCGSNGIATSKHKAQGPEFKLQYCLKKKKSLFTDYHLKIVLAEVLASAHTVSGLLFSILPPA
jgi:hypothetical protein